MEPILPNSPANKCFSTTGSNCVTYNGETISCIPKCNGDTVSNVLYKLGQQQCYTTSLLDWSSLDFGCCYEACPNCQNPTKPIDIIQIMFNCICTQAARITVLEQKVNVLNAGI